MYDERLEHRFTTSEEPARRCSEHPGCVQLLRRLPSKPQGDDAGWWHAIRVSSRSWGLIDPQGTARRVAARQGTWAPSALIPAVGYPTVLAAEDLGLLPPSPRSGISRAWRRPRMRA